jgi:hypothetical protein
LSAWLFASFLLSKFAQMRLFFGGEWVTSFQQVGQTAQVAREGAANTASVRHGQQNENYVRKAFWAERSTVDKEKEFVNLNPVAFLAFPNSSRSPSPRESASLVTSC